MVQLSKFGGEVKEGDKQPKFSDRLLFNTWKEEAVKDTKVK